MQVAFVCKLCYNERASVVFEWAVEMRKIVLFDARSSKSALLHYVLLQVVVMVGKILNAVPVEQRHL